MTTANDFLNANPKLESLDLMVVDANGCLRGKRVPREIIKDALRKGVLLPRSTYASDICGQTVEDTGLGISTGDQDRLCIVDPATLRIVPNGNGDAAQCLMEMQNEDGTPFPGSSRQVLRNVVKTCRESGIHPTVAVELEFYLVRRGIDPTGRLLPLRDPVSGKALSQTQILSLDDLDQVGPFIQQVRDDAALQSVPASAASSEYAPGQFEINLHHTDDPLAACDDAILLKQIIRRAARKHDMVATFMAKPFQNLSGSGSHLHVSVWSENGENLLSKDRNMLQHSIAGLLETMPDAMLLFAPHANSYRRFQELSYVPMSPCWGYNNRTVALRIPAGPAESRRIEHRTPGADCNPYLAMAAMLAGILYGIDSQAFPSAPVEGNAADLCNRSLPGDWLTSIRAFSESSWASKYFGNEFCSLLSAIKHAEFSAFQRQVPVLDYEWYLHSA